jgi:hypothetical protein
MGKEEMEGLEKEVLGIPTTEAAGTGAQGTEAAGTGAPGTEAPVVKKDDPEFELEFGEEGKKEKKKIKLSDLHKGYMQNDDYTKKTQELSSEKEKIKDLIAWSENVKKNPEAVKLIINLSKALESGDKDRIAKAIGVFEAKVVAKKEETVEKIEDIEKELEGLDPESPEYKVTIRLLKQNQGFLKKLEDLEGKVDKTSGTIQKTQDDNDKKEMEAAVEQASKVLNTTLTSLTDAKTGEVKFDSDEAVGLWRKLVLSHLRDNPKEYKDENDFVETIKIAGKKIHAEISKMSEVALAKYIKTKETPIPHKPGGSGDATPKPMTMDNLQSNIETALQEELNNKK